LKFFCILERLHLEQQGAVKMKCWRRNKAQKPEPKRVPDKKLTSNVLLESLSMLDLPTSSTLDSIPNSNTSSVLSDMNLCVSQEITCLDNFKQLPKTSRNIKNRKFSVQTPDNAFELNIECPKITADQTRTENSQLFAMPVSNDVSTITTNNSLTITTSKINNQSTVGNISSKSIFNNFTSQPVSNINSCHNIGNNMTNKSISNNNTSQSMAVNITSQSMAVNITSQSMAVNITSQSVASNIISQSIANSNIKLDSTQAAVTNSRNVINKSLAVKSNNQTLVNNNKVSTISYSISLYIYI